MSSLRAHKLYTIGRSRRDIRRRIGRPRIKLSGTQRTNGLPTYNLVIRESEELFLETIAVLNRIFLRQECDNLIGPSEEKIAITPYTVLGVP